MKKSLCSRLRVITKRNRNKNHTVKIDKGKTKESLKSNKAEFYNFIEKVYGRLKGNLENKGRSFFKKPNRDKKTKASIIIKEIKSGKTTFFNLIDEESLPVEIIYGELDPERDERPRFIPCTFDNKLFIRVQKFFK